MSQHISQAGNGGKFSLTQSRAVRVVNDFLESPWFILLVCVLTAVSNLFRAELLVYTLFILFAVYIALLGRDFLPIMPLAISCYIAPSVNNNPGRNETSVFYPQNGGIYLLVLFLIFAVCTVIRLVKDKELGGMHFLKRKRKLLPGIVILGIGYVLGGAFSGRYFEHGFGNFGFALMQFLAIFVMYWFFSGAVRWEKAHHDYFAWVGLGVGLTVCCELIGVFITNQVIVDSTIKTSLIASGWGNANNIGCMIAMMIPFAFALAQRSKASWLFCCLAVVLFALTCLTCSRTAILVAFFVYIVAMIPAFCDKAQRKNILIFNGITLVALIILFVVFHERLDMLFEELRSRGFAPRLRDKIYPEGIRVFLENPIFGEGFYPSTDVIYEWSDLDQFKAILPARWHNTVIQLLASCGIVGLAAYSFHRVQTIKLLWKKHNPAALFVGLSLAAMLLMSLLDCHFFNIGPVLFYSMGLAFIEHIPDV